MPLAPGYSARSELALFGNFHSEAWLRPTASCAPAKGRMPKAPRHNCFHYALPKAAGGGHPGARLPMPACCLGSEPVRHSQRHRHRCLRRRRSRVRVTVSKVETLGYEKEISMHHLWLLAAIACLGVSALRAQDPSRSGRSGISPVNSDHLLPERRYSLLNS